MFLKDLPDTFDKPIKVGSTIYLIRKFSFHVEETELTHVNEGSSPSVDVKWNYQHRYKLDLVNNHVLALEATVRHRQEMKAWYVVWEPQRKKLIELFATEKMLAKKKRKFGR